jgi:hypothetical protein
MPTTFDRPVTCVLAAPQLADVGTPAHPQTSGQSAPADAEAHVLGVTCADDVSARDIHAADVRALSQLVALLGGRHHVAPCSTSSTINTRMLPRVNGW